jgi:plasmid stabilization system protein ParE
MEVYRISITDVAKQDIRDIENHITDEFQEPVVARNTTDAILDAVITLEQMPDRIALVKDKRLAAQGIRPLYVKNYTVFFRIGKSPNVVYVVRIIYSHRDWASIL